MRTSETTFNGSYTGTQNDKIEYCPYCGKKLPEDTEVKYCPFCGKAIPRTYTGSQYVIHWNLPDGRSTYPEGY